MNNYEIIYTIIIVAVITLLLRIVPFLIFKNVEKTPKIITYLGEVLPLAIYGFLVVYCLKDIGFSSEDKSGISAVISICLIVLFHVIKKNSLLSIGVGTIVYMLLINLL